MKKIFLITLVLLLIPIATASICRQRDRYADEIRTLEKENSEMLKKIQENHEKIKRSKKKKELEKESFTKWLDPEYQFRRFQEF